MKSFMKSVLVGAAFSLSVAAVAAQECEVGVADLRWDAGTTRFSVELADDADERAVGLMNRESMARFSGMVFAYQREQPVAFWMKNTLIPLDILFFDRRGVLQHIHQNAIPLDLTAIPGGDKIQYVLEINGGVADMLGIKVGAEMRHSSISKGIAAWAC